LVIDTPSALRLGAGSVMEVPKGSILRIDRPGTLTLESGSRLEIEAPTRVEGVVNVNGGRMIVDSPTTLTIASGGRVDVNGGGLEVTAGSTAYILEGGVLNVNTAGMEAVIRGKLDVQGRVNIENAASRLNIRDAGEMLINTGANLGGAGSLIGDGTLVIRGRYDVPASGTEPMVLAGLLGVNNVKIDEGAISLLLLPSLLEQL
jgi:hypothetical protein